MEQDVTVKLTELDQRVGANTRRIEGLERGQEALNRLITAVEVLAAKQKSTCESVEKINDKLDVLEQKPARRWENLIDKILLVMAGAFVSFLLTHGGIGG